MCERERVERGWAGAWFRVRDVCGYVFIFTSFPGGVCVCVCVRVYS